MASPQAYDKFGANNKLVSFPVDEDLTTADVAVSVGTGAEVWLDMKGFSGVFVVVTGINLGGTGVEAVSIIGDSDSDGTSGTNVTIATSGDSAMTGEGGYLTVECSAEQMAQEGADNSVALRYIGIEVENQHSGDEVVVTVIRYGGRAFDGLTAGSVAGATIT